ncbi:MAG: 3-deoxy-D-manno-octulosonic acid transferase [Rhodoferax sp.]|nr:3-deoxy-D-manno-octulosonic acid transferase [Pseudorhodobacter sp.]
MAYSLGLTLYNLANRRDAAPSAARAARPNGRLVWLHVPGPDQASPMLELARRLAFDDGYNVLITCPVPLPLPKGVLQDTIPHDTPADTKAFLAHWRPEMAILADGELRPALLHEAADQQIPVIMVQGRMPYLLRSREGWYPGLARSLLNTIPHILTLDEPSARAFRKAGAFAKAVEVAGRMEEKSTVLAHTEAERASLAEVMATRPAWLVAGLAEAEEDAIIAAHSATLRMSHRLLLIVVPQTAKQAEALAAKIEQSTGWNVALRAADEEPEPEVEVLIADSPAELGLWYRLASITFLGGSLLGTGCLRNPMEGAALGSSLIGGSRPGEFGLEFGRLSAANALRAVTSPADLTRALSELLDPDRAAHLANAAWRVASDGAEVTDRVITLIRRIIDGDI